MTEVTDKSEWYNTIALARITASADLKTSNDLLEIIDTLIDLPPSEVLSLEKRVEIAKQLLEIAKQLSGRSREMSTSISKLVGVI
jgi:hypothetical protein